VRVGCLGASVLFPDDDLEVLPIDRNQPADVPKGSGFPAPKAPARSGAEALGRGETLDDRLRHIETVLITAALEQSRGNKSKAADLLGVKRSTLGDRIARLALDQGVSGRVAFPES
jgi:DNA-binding NtrC family response regulator